MLGVACGAVSDGWVHTDAPADRLAAAIGAAGTLRAVMEVVWEGPHADVPASLPRARRVWTEAQWINQAAGCRAVAARVAGAAGGPEPVPHPDGPPGLITVINRQGRVLIGQAIAWGLERQRPYRVALMARSLNPAMGRALAMASRARPGDAFCDPFCGSGTILAERALIGGCRLFGLDRDAGALDAAGRALSGFLAQGMAEADLVGGDAADLPWATGAMDAVATNLPFGHRMGQARENAALYPAALREAVRVLRPRGRLVLLTADRRHLRQAVDALGPALRPRSQVRVWLGGLEPTLAVYDRTEAAVS